MATVRLHWHIIQGREVSTRHRQSRARLGLVVGWELGAKRPILQDGQPRHEPLHHIRQRGGQIMLLLEIVLYVKEAGRGVWWVARSADERVLPKPVAWGVFAS